MNVSVDKITTEMQSPKESTLNLQKEVQNQKKYRVKLISNQRSAYNNLLAFLDKRGKAI